MLARAARDSDVAAVFWARMTRLRDALAGGRGAIVEAELDELARLSEASRRTYYRWYRLVLAAASATFAGRLAEGERLAAEAVELNRRHGEDGDQEHTVQRLALALQRRRPREAPLAELRDYAARYAALPVWRAMLAQVEWGTRNESGRASVEACARDGFQPVLRTPDWLCGLVLLAAPVAEWGAPEQVGQLAAALEEHAERNAVMDDACAAFGPVARALGVLAAAAGRAAEADAYFEQAIELAARWGAPGWELAAIGDWLERGAPETRADALRDRGRVLARDLDLPWVAASLGQTTTP